MRKQRRNLLLLATLLLTACSPNGIVYDHSADVDPCGWAPADTLFYPIYVTPVAQPGAWIDSVSFYQLSLAVRYQLSYPCQTLPLHLCFNNGQKEQLVHLSLADNQSIPDGDHWSSLYTKEFDVTGLPIHFDTTGNYMLKIWPDSIQTDICSVTVTLSH